MSLCEAVQNLPPALCTHYVPYPLRAHSAVGTWWQSPARTARVCCAPRFAHTIFARAHMVRRDAMLGQSHLRASHAHRQSMLRAEDRSHQICSGQCGAARRDARLEPLTCFARAPPEYAACRGPFAPQLLGPMWCCATRC